MYILTRENQDSRCLTWTSNSPSWLNFAANVIIIGMTAVIISQNCKLIQLNEQKIAEDKENLRVLQEIKEKI